ncbi:MAG: helix-turn-helix transcriptional regulator [Faecalimonas umbilicata]|uniref:helix-turn-helix domain-containing protein n=1 Tax=Faecalimonas umbilicata TaxID=1912855 RepID=UPI00242C0430|nr:helix-turn-helix transcriptional regulator [Faecalimonas umbilicata]MCI5985443.1 helix-turn-helix transcriptional regulator [Faecalimonas umbilicata]MDY5094018.1 helix-turn-helix transcriptional regulator [Faecalimonas umbilicata]
MKMVYIDLENLLKERGISKNKVCENCRLQRTQLNNYCQNKVSRIDLNTLAKLCEYPDCTPNDILKIRDDK